MSQLSINKRMNLLQGLYTVSVCLSVLRWKRLGFCCVTAQTSTPSVRLGLIDVAP